MPQSIMPDKREEFRRSYVHAYIIPQTEFFREESCVKAFSLLPPLSDYFATASGLLRRAAPRNDAVYRPSLRARGEAIQWSVNFLQIKTPGAVASEVLGAATCKVCSLPALFSLAAQLAVNIVLHQVATRFGGCCCHFHGRGLSSVVWPGIWAFVNERNRIPLPRRRMCRNAIALGSVLIPRCDRSVHAQLVAVFPYAF